MIIATKRSRFRYFFDILLTTLGWVVFFFLFASGILAVLRGERNDGPEVPLVPPLLLPSVSTVLGYGVVMVLFAALLIGWAKYNQRRFAGVDRRRPPPPLSQMQLCDSFGISHAQLDHTQEAQVMIVHHDDDGIIRSIEVVDENTTSLSKPPATKPRSLNMTASISPIFLEQLSGKCETVFGTKNYGEDKDLRCG